MQTRICCNAKCIPNIDSNERSTLFLTRLAKPCPLAWGVRRITSAGGLERVGQRATVLFRTVVPATQLPTRTPSLRNRAKRANAPKVCSSKYRGTTAPGGVGPVTWRDHISSLFCRLTDRCFCCRLVGHFETVTDSSASGGKRRVISVVFPERIEMRFTQSENIPFE